MAGEGMRAGIEFYLFQAQAGHSGGRRERLWKLLLPRRERSRQD